MLEAIEAIFKARSGLKWQDEDERFVRGLEWDDSLGDGGRLHGSDIRKLQSII